MNIYIETYGCTANKSDASIVKGLIKNNQKYLLVEKQDDADIIIILTCTVIDTTEQRMLHRLKTFQKNDKKIIITGCMATVQVEKIKKEFPDFKLLEPQKIHKILDLIEDIKHSNNKKKYQAPKYFDSVIAPISIAEGCFFSCTYCITCLARGKLMSSPIKSIVKDVEYAIKNGCKEIQLTAQDTASYGIDKKTRLSDLINEICHINIDFRIRIGMMNPATLKNQINEMIKAYGNTQIYKFLHIPVQSGDNDILKLMNRGYQTSDFKKIISRFREKIPEITIATDVIIGFPTETENQFQKTIDLINEIKPDITNITRYSARPNTKAKEMKGRIPTEIVKQRSQKITEITKNISNKKNKKFIGKKYNVLILEEGKNNTYIGRNINYKPVVIEKNVEIGVFKQVEITDAYDTYLVGMLI
jgi:MiaB-like tRNA modifying enzyme